MPESINLRRAKAGEWDQIDKSYLTYLVGPGKGKYPKLTNDAQAEINRRNNGGNGGNGGGVPQPAATGGVPAKHEPNWNNLSPKERSNNLRAVLNRMIPDFETALQKRIDPNVLIYAVLNSANKNPKILGCSRESILRSAIYLAQIQLMPDTPDQHAHLVPFGGECTVIVNYQGYIELAHRSERVKTIHAQLVYENDEFEETLGTERKLYHKRLLDGDRGKIIGAYAVAELINGAMEWTYMPFAELEKIKNTSKSATKPGSAWQTWPTEMHKKAPVRRLHKFIPTTPQMSLAKQLDETASMGESQEGLIDTDYEILPEETEKPEPQTKSDRLDKKFKKQKEAAKSQKEPEKKEPEKPKAKDPGPPTEERQTDADPTAADLIALIATNEDALRKKVGDDHPMFKYTAQQVEGWTAKAIADTIHQTKLILTGEESPQLDLGKGQAQPARPF
jgi:recombination protein RecT